MTNDITANTNFSSVTITNDYPCLVGGTWTAKVDADGITYYTNGTTTYYGPVNLIGGTLTIYDGAVVTGLTALNSATITVSSGGTIENSDIFSSTVTVNAGGESENNNYISTSMTFGASSTSSNDTFYYPGTTSTTSGNLNLSQLPSGTSTSFRTSNGTTSFTVASTAANIIDPHFPNLSSSNTTAPTSGYQTLWVGPSSQFGNSALATTTDYSNYKFTLSNDNPTYYGGTWTASLNSDGVTVYTATGVSSSSAGTSGTVGPITGPINLVNSSGLTIKSGAVVDGLTMTGNNNPTISNSGTIQNSFVSNGYIDNLAGAVSQNNTYVSEVLYARSGSTSSNDLFYSGVGSYAYYNFSQKASGMPTYFLLDDGGANIYLYSGSTWDNSYVQTGSTSGSNVYIYRFYGSDVACFLAGSMIQTTTGYVAIEDIQVGDNIVVYNGSENEHRTIIWKGFNKVVVNTHLDDLNAGYPIRILPNAIADGVPYKDMLITPEHCLFFNNQFVPAYMLVNGCSIFYDRSITEYTYYHIETEVHSVINADGMLTESYLDTGNRHSYYQEKNVVSIHNKNKIWGVDSAASLVTSRNVVEPIYNQILARISLLGLSYTFPTRKITEDNGLFLITDSGEILNKSNTQKGRFIFIIPPNTNSVRLISNTSKPTDVIGPFVGDHRNLGILVGTISLLSSNDIYHIDTHLTTPRARGWDKEMPENCRWTNGDAFVALPNKNRDSIRMLVVQVIAGGPYLVKDKTRNEIPLQSKAG